MLRILVSLACLVFSVLGRKVQGRDERRSYLQRRRNLLHRSALKDLAGLFLSFNQPALAWRAVGHAHRLAVNCCRARQPRLRQSLLEVEKVLDTLVAPGIAVPKRIRFLISDTGGGHRASAMALSDALEACFPGKFECDVVDLYVESGCYPFCDYPEIYKQLAANPWLWKLVAFDFGASPFGIWFNDLITEIICFKEFRRLLEASPRPDAVICVHPLLNAIPLKALAEADGGQRKTPFLTVVTDLGSAHPSWFDKRVDKCFVPSDVLHRFARRRGLSHEQIAQFGLPIRRGFWSGPGKPDGIKDRVRDRLGLAKQLPTVMVVGGGDGMGGVVATAEAIGAELGAEGIGESYQMVIICGRNQEAVEMLRATAWPSTLQVTVLGFVDNMDEYMAAADLLVTKAGPGTIAEATAMGLPCVLNSFLPGQEVGNVDFVRDGGFGEYHSDPEEVARLTATYLADEAKLEEMAAAARRAGRPEATMRIADEIGELLGVKSSHARRDHRRNRHIPQSKRMTAW